MLLATTLLASLALITPVLSQNSNYPACVNTCIQDNPTSSFCDGDETGEELAACTCASLQTSLMLTCIRECSSEDQAAYAERLPDSCARTLFPNLPTDNNDDDDHDDDQPSASSTGPQPTATGVAPEATTGAAIEIRIPGALAAGGLLAAVFL